MNQRAIYGKFLSLVALLISLAPPCLAESSEGQVAASLRPYLDKHCFAGGVALIGTRNRIIDLEAVGYSDLGAGKRMKTDNIFWIASMTKPFTASALMMLIDEHKLQLDDPVEKYLPEFKGQEVSASTGSSSLHQGRFDQDGTAPQEGTFPPGQVVASTHPITIREILSHTSGLPKFSRKEHGALDSAPLVEAVREYGHEPLMTQPGVRFSYSNEGLNTAGRIIEVVSGMPYERFIQERLLTPLNMIDTTFYPTSEQIGRLAKSYRLGPNLQLSEVPISMLTYPLSSRHNRYPIPAGGLFSTAVDVSHFLQMLLNEGVFNGKRLLSKSAVEAITSKETPQAVDAKYGLGMSLTSSGFGHGGAYKTDMVVDTKKGLICVFLVQKADRWEGDEGNAFRRILETQGMALLGGDASIGSELQQAPTSQLHPDYFENKVKTRGRLAFPVIPSAADPSLKTEFDFPNLVVIPRGAPRSQLVLFLPGTQAKPAGSITLMRMLSESGYRAISLTYNNYPGLDICARGSDLNCSQRFREERFLGDAPDAEVKNSVAESINSRLVNLLAYLNHMQPDQGWGDFLANGQPAWEKIIVSGHSQGAGMAAFIAKKRAVARVVCFSGPADGINMRTISPQLSPWQSVPGKTSASRWYAEYSPKEMGAANLINGYKELGVPQAHVLCFNLGLAGGDSARPAAYHVSVVTDPRYSPQWHYLFGIDDGASR